MFAHTMRRRAGTVRLRYLVLIIVVTSVSIIITLGWNMRDRTEPPNGQSLDAGGGELRATENVTLRPSPEEPRVEAADESGRSVDSLGPRTVATVSMGEFLRDYWGDEWSRHEASLLERGVDLDERIDPSIVIPWEEAEPELRKVILGDVDEIIALWGQAVSPELTDAAIRSSVFNPEQKVILEVDMRAIRGVVSDYESPIRDALDNVAAEEMRYRQQVWDEGRCALGPLFAVGGQPPFAWESGAGVAVSHRGNGWATSIRLDPSFDAKFQAAIDHMHAIRAERRRAILAYVGAL